MSKYFMNFTRLIKERIPADFQNEKMSKLKMIFHDDITEIQGIQFVSIAVTVILCVFVLRNIEKKVRSKRSVTSKIVGKSLFEKKKN